METFLFNKPETTGRFSTYLAIASFVFGSLLLLFYKIFPDNSGFLIFGFFYVLFATLFNGVVFLNLLYRFCVYPNDREALAIKMLIMLANIPITILYFYIAIQQNYSY